MKHPTITLWRCTRNAPYDSPTCPGHLDPRQRQGYYIPALTSKGALAEMGRLHPHDTAGFTAEAWTTVTDWKEAC